MSTNPEPLPVTDLNETRLLRDMALLAAARVRVRELEAKVSAGCRKWSDANGYRAVCTPEQVLKAIEHRERKA